MTTLFDTGAGDLYYFFGFESVVWSGIFTSGICVQDLLSGVWLSIASDSDITRRVLFLSLFCKLSITGRVREVVSSLGCNFNCEGKDSIDSSYIFSGVGVMT